MAQNLPYSNQNYPQQIDQTESPNVQNYMQTIGNLFNNLMQYQKNMQTGQTGMNRPSNNYYAPSRSYHGGYSSGYPYNNYRSGR